MENIKSYLLSFSLILFGVFLEKGFDYIKESVEHENLIYKKNLQKKLKLIDEKLNNFYLPLKNKLEESNLLFLEYKKRYSNSKIIKSIEKSIITPEILRWQRYMLSVFQPIHIKMQNIIFSKKHLALEKNELLSKKLEELSKHIAQYQIIFSQWRDNDFSEHFSITKFPNDLIEYINEDIKLLKKEKQNLINKLGE